jgi:hypothetical protein
MQINNGITISPGITIGDEQYSPVVPVTPEWFYKTTIYNSANTPIPDFGNMFGVSIENGPQSWSNDVKIGNRITNLTTGQSSIVTNISYGFTYLQLNQTYANTSILVYLNNSNAMPTGNSQNYIVESRVKEITLSYGTTSWTVPADWNNSNNIIQIWGAGGGGASVNSNTTYATGGGGGGYTTLENVSLTPGQVITITIGQGGAAMVRGGNTSFGSYASANGGGPGVISFGINPQNGGTGELSGGHGGYHTTVGVIRGNGLVNYVTRGGSGGGGAGYFDPTGGGGLGGNGGFLGGFFGSDTYGGIGWPTRPYGGYGFSTPYTGGGGGAGSPGPGQYGYFSYGGPGGTPAGGGGAGLPTGGTGGNGQIFITYRPL